MAAITMVIAKQIAACTQTQGRCLLATLLNLGPYEDEKNIQNAIQVDFLHDHLMFAVNKGFPWNQVVFVLKFAQQFLSGTQDKTITEAVKLYQASMSDLLSNLGEQRFKDYSSFIFSTFFTHFQLYKYVLTSRREWVIPRVAVDVHPPIPPLPMTMGTEKSIWNYRHRLEELEHREAQLSVQRLSKQAQIKKEFEAKKAETFTKVATLGQPFSKALLGDLVKSIIADYTASSSRIISSNIEDVFTDLEVKLEIASLPRPSNLGPPSRFTMKSSTPSSQAKSPLQQPSKGSYSNITNNNTETEDQQKSAKSAVPGHLLSSSKSPVHSRVSSSQANRH